MSLIIFGTTDADLITPDTISTGVSGLPSSGGERIDGLEGNDTIDGGGGDDSINGGLGDDLIFLGLGVLVADGGDGIDTLDTTIETSGLLVNLATGTTSVPGAQVANIENLLAGIGNDTLTGSDLANHMTGGGGRDLIRGEQGNDTLIGGFGNDRLIGGKGTDLLSGGAGRDVFLFDDGDSVTGPVSDKLVASAQATAFEGAGAALGDLIDVSRIDADRTLAGDQGFVFGGKGKGHIHVAAPNLGASVVYANTDDDKAFEFALFIADGGLAAFYTAADFIL